MDGGAYIEGFLACETLRGAEGCELVDERRHGGFVVD